jgi:hypothetical protein
MLKLAERESEHGAIVIEFVAPDGQEIGRLAAERERLCWAIARDQKPRLSDIFIEECGISSEVLEDAVKTAAEKGAPFGEELVERNLIGEDDLRRCLRRQMVVALGTMAGQWRHRERGEGDAVSPLEGISYDPSYTVGTLEVLLACVSESGRLAEEYGAVPAGFRELAARLAGAVCFFRAETEEEAFLPVAAVNAADLSLHEAADLGRSALAIADPPTLRAASVLPHAVLIHHEGNGFVCTRSDTHLCVFEVRGREQYGDLLANLVARARAPRSAGRGS